MLIAFGLKNFFLKKTKSAASQLLSSIKNIIGLHIRVLTVNVYKG